MVEFQIVGVQEISSIAGQAGEISRGWPVKPYIADQGMVDGCEMDSDLIRAARV